MVDVGYIPAMIYLGTVHKFPVFIISGFLSIHTEVGVHDSIEGPKLLDMLSLDGSLQGNGRYVVHHPMRAQS